MMERRVLGMTSYLPSCLPRSRSVMSVALVAIGLGAEDFPVTAQKAAHAGNPVLEVAIRADGTISDVVIRRSSGSKELDHAAIQILNRASPFNPFPTDLRQKYDELRFAYVWQFLGGPGKVSASGNYATR